jgi:hypothetical protein
VANEADEDEMTISRKICEKSVLAVYFLLLTDDRGVSKRSHSDKSAALMGR